MPTKHIIEPGETLAGIAQQYGVSVKSLCRVNTIRDPDLIHAGDMLHIPQDDASEGRRHMSTRDIVNRLRIGADTSVGLNEHLRKYQALCNEAASHIEELRRADAKARQRGENIDGSPRRETVSAGRADSLMGRLEQIAQHDWRLSFLAHTPDTAREAAAALRQRDATIAELRSELSAVPKPYQHRAEAAEACVTDLQRRLDETLVALARIEQCADAYPASAFPEPDFDRVYEVLRAAGIPLDVVSASNMRRALQGVGGIARDALAAVRREGE